VLEDFIQTFFAATPATLQTDINETCEKTTLPTLADLIVDQVKTLGELIEQIFYIY
jgi:hypothetical protein